MDEGEDAGWSSGEDTLPVKHLGKSTRSQTGSKPFRGARAKQKAPAWSAPRRNNATAPAPLFVKGDVIETAPTKQNLMKDYSSSSSSSGWSDAEEDPPRKDCPSLIPAQLLGPLPTAAPPQATISTSQMPKASTASRSLWAQSTERRQSSSATQPSLSSSNSSQVPDKRKGQAKPLSANVMETKYGVGFDLMSKMGLSESQIQTSATPIVPEQRQKDEGISSAPKLPEVSEKPKRQRGRKRKALSSSESSSSEDSAVSSDVEEIQPRSYGVSRGESTTSPMKKAHRRMQTSHPYSRSPPEKTIQESLREMRGNVEPGAIIDCRGAVSSVHASIATIISQPNIPKSSPRESEESRRHKIMCFADRLKEVEIDLRRRCEESQKLALDLMRTASRRDERAIRELSSNDAGDEDRLQFGGDLAAPPLPSTDIVDLTNLQIGSEGLQIEWLIDQINQLEEEYPAEMIQLKFRLRADSLAEMALEADLQVLANLDNPNGDANKILGSELQKGELLDRWTMIHPALVELRNYIVGQDPNNSQAAQIFDCLIRKTVLARFLKPFFQHCWDPVSDADIGAELMELSVSTLVSKNEFNEILQSLIVPKLSVTMELESSRFESYPPHLWLGQWLPNLSGEMEEAILAKLMNTALENFVNAPIAGRTKVKAHIKLAGSSAPAIIPNSTKEAERNNVDQSLLVGQWLLTWKTIFSREQWNMIIFQGVFGLLKRWLTAPELSPALSSQVPDTLSVFLNIWRQDLPTSLISSTVVETYGARVLDWLRNLQETNGSLNAMAALDGYGSWKILRKEQLPELKSFLKEVLDLLEKVIQK